MEKKYDKWGREIFPMTAEEQQTYNRLMKTYPKESQLIEVELLQPTEQRDWVDLEDTIVELC